MFFNESYAKPRPRARTSQRLPKDFFGSDPEIAQRLPDHDNLARQLVEAAQIAKRSTMARRNELGEACSCSPLSTGLVPLVAPLAREALSSSESETIRNLAPAACDLIRFGGDRGAKLPRWLWKFDETTDSYSCPLIEGFSLPVPRNVFPAGADVVLKDVSASVCDLRGPALFARWVLVDSVMAAPVAASPAVAAVRSQKSPADLIADIAARGVLTSSKQLMQILAGGKVSLKMCWALTYRAPRWRGGWRCAFIKMQPSGEKKKRIEIHYNPAKFADELAVVEYLNNRYGNKAQFFSIRSKSN